MGRICIRSRFAAAEYLEGGLDNVVPFPEEGLCPGDIGAMTPAGVLVIAGRENSVVNLDGSKSLERIEEALMSFAGIRDAVAFTYQNQLGINQLAGAVVWSEGIERASAACSSRS